MHTSPLLAALAGILLGCGSSQPAASPAPFSSSTSASKPDESAKAPDFIGTASDWINSKPLSLKELRGKVVLVDFWEYTCVNCIRTYPYLNEWWRRYKNDGLVIVGIHTPEFKFAATKANVVESAKQYGLEFPILIDSQYKNWNAWHNQFWPNKYLIDNKGNIVLEHAGEGGYDDVEVVIQHLLKRRNPNLVLPPLMKEVRASDKPGAVCYPITEEMYAGDRGSEEGQLGFTPREVGAEKTYKEPTDLSEGVFYLGGNWTPEHEYVSAGKGAKLAMRYKAKDANMVLNPASGAVRVYVLQDGKPIRKEDAGDDTKFDGDGSYMLVSSPRMYSVTHNEKWGKHRLDFTVEGAGLRVYTFAFSSDCQP